jgi:L-iditol 2-dehydrogenase
VRALIKTGTGPGTVSVRQTARPVPARGEALVRIAASGLCGTDLLLFDDRYRGRNRPVPSPVVVGHEASGDVVELGPDTIGPGAGTRVAIEAVRGCGQCHQCARGHYNLCPDWHHIGLTCDGALAEFVVVPTASLLPLPASVTHESAALLEPLATAVHTLERVTLDPSRGAAIVGPGPLGWLHVQLLQAAGVSPVVLYGRPGDDARLAVASRLGADVFLGDASALAAHAAQATGGRGFGLAIEAGGSSAAIQTVLDIVGGAGTVVSLGIVPPTELDVLQVMRKNLTWVGVVSSVRRHFDEALRLVHAGAVRPTELITHRLTLDEAAAGFDLMRRREAVKVMVAV